MDQRIRRKLDSLVKLHGDAGALAEGGWTMRDGRFVLSVRSSAKRKIHGIMHGRSQSGGTLFIEPDELVELAGERRRLEEEEQREIRRILIELTDLVREHLHELNAAIVAIGRLDSIQARARFAETFGAMRPRLSKNTLRLVQARHPLLVLRKGLKGTVPLDLELGGEGPDDRALVITGPNAGGKTVALKTIGLTTTLVHAGVWPPAGDGTEIPPLELWHVVIGDDQSLESDLSSFSGHLERLREITELPERPKLVLIDEIAAGTDPTEGSTLAAALLEESVRRGWWTVVTTHMGQLKAFAHRTEGVRNGSMQFDRKQLTPTYRFVPDIPGSSYALEIAERVGLPDEVVQRAREMLGEERMRLEDLIEELGDRLGKVHAQERELERLRSQTSGLERRLQERIGELEGKRAEKLAKASEEAERLLAEANRAIEHAVKEIRESQASRDAIRQARERVQQQKQRTEKTRKSAEQTRKKTLKQASGSRQETDRQHAPEKESAIEDLPGAITVGDSVRLESGQIAEVLALQGKKAQVAAGAVKVWMPIDNMTRIRQARGRSGGVNLHLNVDEEEAPTRTELKLIGMRAEQAENALEKYLEDLALSGLQTARIVHGKGTGALRAMVEEVLNRNPLVSSHRLGEQGEGGDGVTIVHLSDK
jgi:DNA mismatch repair protein MutS2